MVKLSTIRTSTAACVPRESLFSADAKDPVSRFAEVQADDVVILPAFGLTVGEMEHLRAKHCVLVDTTCGSVLNVWKKVQRCARDGFTVVIHGKHYHEETRATASQALMYNGQISLPS